MQLYNCVFSVPWKRAVRAAVPGLDLGADPAQDRQPGTQIVGSSGRELFGAPHIPTNKTSVMR